jgi:hypothetical protein
MTFIWPWMVVVALAAVPARPLGYRRMLRRQARVGPTSPASGLVTPTPSRPDRARHVVPVLFAWPSP